MSDQEQYFNIKKEIEDLGSTKIENHTFVTAYKHGHYVGRVWDDDKKTLTLSNRSETIVLTSEDLIGAFREKCIWFHMMNNIMVKDFN